MALRQLPRGGMMKGVIVGDGAVGKTSFLCVAFHLYFPENGWVPNYYDDHIRYDIEWRGKLHAITFWDTAAQEDYDRLRPLSYPGTDIFIIAFSVASPASLQRVQSKWVPEISHHCPDIPFILVGLQQDLRTAESVISELKKRGKHIVTEAEGQEMAKKIGAGLYMECSALKKDGSCAHVVERTALQVLRGPPRKPQPGPAPPRPGLPFVPKYSLKNDLATLYNNPNSLPDLNFSSANGSTTILAHSVVLNAMSPAYKSKRMESLFIATKEENGLSVRTLKEEFERPFFLLLKADSSVVRKQLKEFAATIGCTNANELIHVDIKSLLPFVNNADSGPDIAFAFPDGSSLCAHRAILALHCERFRALFSSGMADAKQKELQIQDYSHDVFLVLLTQLYSFDEIEVSLPTRDCIALLAAANEYIIPLLTLSAARALRNQISPATWLDINSAAELHNFPPLLACCFYDIRCNWPAYADKKDILKVVGSQHWKELESMQYPPLEHVKAVYRWEQESATLFSPLPNVIVAAWKRRQENSDQVDEESERCAVQ